MGTKAIGDIKKGPYQDWQNSKWALVLALILGVLPAYLVPFIFSRQGGSAGFDPGSMLNYLIFFCGGMSLILVLILRYLNGEMIKDLNLMDGSWWKDILLGIGLMAITLSVFFLSRNFINQMFPAQGSSDLDPLFDRIVNDKRFFLLLTGPGLLIGAGIYEELTRVFLLSRLWKIWDNGIWRWVVVLFSAVLFGLMHSYQGPAGVVSTGLSGLITGIFYLRSGRILPMVIAHYLHDALQFIMVYLMFS
jgi:membrane protease YdiL (CAAX protease family)